MSLFTFSAFAQEVVVEDTLVTGPNVSAHASSFTGIDGVYEKHHISQKKYIPYVHVREADVMWSKTIWRIIDLREKMNLPLYYPTTRMEGRRSLVQVIYDALELGDVQAYDATTNDSFERRLTKEEFRRALGAGVDSLYDEEGNVVITYSDAHLEQIQRLLLKEVWWFDRRYGRMDVRIIAVCPIRESTEGEGESERVKAELCFWIYYPELRPYLSQQEVYNTRNDAQRSSYDDLMAQRHFASYIYRESNVYNNRAIVEYAQGLDANLEARRIHETIFNKEHDMWEY